MKKFIFLMLIIFLIDNHAVFGVDWHPFRNHEVIAFTGNSLSRYISIPINQVFFYSYCERDNSWHQITFQIDEVDQESGYFGGNYNGIIDIIDEFYFVAGDAGDCAPPTSWIDDEESRQYFRHQLELSDPDDPLLKKYVYAYRSSVLAHHPNLPYYIDYIAPGWGASDTIKAIAYLAGQNEKGIPEVWKIADSAGVYGPDILDRQKARVNGKYLSLINYKMDENDLIVDKIRYKKGPVRIIRDISYKARMSGIDVNVGTFRYRYYPFHIEALGADKTLDDDYGVKLIRQSFDLSPDATGMLFNNPNNFDVVVDGVNDAIDLTIQPKPVMNWCLYTGVQGTAVVLNEFTPPSNASYELYYQESLTGGTADGTSDTGDGKSYGDVGILFKGNKLKGSLSLPYFNYFLPDQQARDVGATIASQTQNQLLKIITVHNYASPAEIAISLPDTSGPALYPISIPVRVGNLTGLNVLSFQLAIQYDPKILKGTGISTVNTLVEKWGPAVITIVPDTIYVTMKGTTALQDSGVLLYLNFDVIGEAGQQTALHFAQAKFNTWNPLAIAHDGIFTTLPPPEVAVTIPDTTGISQTNIAIPIRVADVTNLNITACQIELKYSKVILNATAVSIEGTLASGWSIQNLVDDPGYLKFEIMGTAPLQGKGTLAWVSFDVLGSPGSSTSILFKKMQFNNGIPIAVTRNGLFTVYWPIGGQITVLIPDTTVQSGGPLHTPVLISQLTYSEIESYNMTLQFDGTVLEFKNVDVAGSHTAMWGSPNVSYSQGKINITAKGDIPVSSLGPLLFIDFDVIGSDGSNTTIHFADMSFNSGSLKAVTDDGIVQVQGVIPVELALFTAKNDGNQVTLYWSTMTESNNFGFHIQQKTDSTPDWQTIGFVPGAGTTTVPQRYSFIVTRLDPGTWYYRLQQQDFDGQVHYSQIIELNLIIPTEFGLSQNYPNPFNSLTVIRYELPVGEHQVKLIIYDLLGHCIRTLLNEENQKAGAYQITWDGRDEAGKTVASSVYFYRLQAGKQIFIKKMVLIE